MANASNPSTLGGRVRRILCEFKASPAYKVSPAKATQRDLSQKTKKIFWKGCSKVFPLSLTPSLGCSKALSLALTQMSWHLETQKARAILVPKDQHGLGEFIPSWIKWEPDILAAGPVCNVTWESCPRPCGSLSAAGRALTEGAEPLLATGLKDVFRSTTVESPDGQVVTQPSVHAFIQTSSYSVCHLWGSLVVWSMEQHMDTLNLLVWLCLQCRCSIFSRNSKNLWSIDTHHPSVGLREYSNFPRQETISSENSLVVTPCK